MKLEYEREKEREGKKIRIRIGTNKEEIEEDVIRDGREIGDVGEIVNG